MSVIELHYAQAVTTVTFFKGASLESAAAVVRARLTKIIAANPFVAGRVIKARGEKLLQLFTPAYGVGVPDDVMDELLRINPVGMPVLSREPSG